MAVKLEGLSPKEALEQRCDLLTNARKLHEAHCDDWGSDHEKQYSEMIDDASRLKAHANRCSQLEMLEKEGNSNPTPRPDPVANPGREQKRSDLRRTLMIRDGHNSNGTPRYVEIESNSVRATEEYNKNFEAYLRTGRPRAGLLEAQANPGAGAPAMAIQSDDAQQAGYLLASEQMAAGILKEIDDLLFIRQHATIHTVAEAASLGIRARTARASTFGWSAELQVSTADTSLKYGKRVLTPHHLTGTIEASRDLLRRSMGTAESEIRSELARDGGEAMEDGYLTGNGSQQPLGVFTASSDGISTARDVATGSATGFTSDGIIDAKYALKQAYRRGGPRQGARWLYHRDAIKLIAKLKDSNNQYLFRIGMGIAQDTGLPEDRLLEFPVDESERVPNTFTTGLYVGMLCNWRYYEIADALDMEIQTLMELKALSNQVQYVARMKTDGMPTLEEAFVRVITS